MFNYICVMTYIICTYYLNTSDPNKQGHNISKLLSLKEYNNPIWFYFVCAIFDVEANYCVTLAYRYTSITSIMLLDCFAIPCVMLLSKTFLNAKYNRNHLLGVGLSISGLACIIAVDASNTTTFNDALLGDMLVLLGESSFVVIVL